MVEKHIKSLLYDHDCVIIPGFGGLITRYVSARINPVKHSLVPPSKKIAFNEKLTLNDGLLISTIAYHNGITKEEAQRLVAEFVHSAKSTLERESRFELQEIGVFKYSSERRLEFEYVESDNLLEASFGLPDLIARPVKKENPAVLRTLIKERQPVALNRKQPLRKRLTRAYRAAAGLMIGGLTVSALYLLSLQTEHNLSSLNPISLFGNSFEMKLEKAISKYTADFVPISQEEREEAYKVILPVLVKEAPVEALASVASVEEETTVLEEEQPVLEEAIIESVAVVAVAEPVKKEEVKPVVVEDPLTIKGKTGRFYIITGGYSKLENAEVGRTEIKKKGQEAKVLLPLPKNKLFRVSVADFATEAEAQAALKDFRKQFGETIWVLNN